MYTYILGMCPFYQVYLVYKDEVLVATPQLISQLPLFTSMLEFCPVDDPVVHLLEVKELDL